MNITRKNSDTKGRDPTGASTRTIALIIKHPHQLDDALRCALAFMAGGAAVSFVCLGTTPIQKGRWHLQPLLDAGAECHTDDAALAKRYGVHLLTPAFLGPYLKRMDWVIPF